MARPFPPLKLQGITVQGREKRALINRKLLELGDHIDDVEVVAIERDTVTLALDGQTNVLRLYAGLPAAPRATTNSPP